MRAWGGRRENVNAAQTAFLRRLRMNSLAVEGQWSAEREQGA